MGERQHSFKGESVTMGFWGRFLLYWEILAKAWVQERPRDGRGNQWCCGAGGFRLKCTA